MKTDQFTSKNAVWVTTVFFALSLYGFGAGTMDSFVVYHTWKFIGVDEFSLAHVQSGSRIVPIFVLPMLVMTVFLVLMFWHRPIVISRTMLWICVLCTTIPWLSSVFIQIPIQIKLDNGKDDALLNKLIFTDWIRIIPHWIMIGVVLTMISRCIRSTAPKPTNEKIRMHSDRKF